MSDETRRFSWLRWIFVGAIVILVGVGASKFLGWPDLSPWEPAAKILSDISISEFSGDPALEHWDLRLKALGGIILLFVLGPSLWIYAEIQNQSKEEEKLSKDLLWHFDDIARKGVVWYVGVVLVITGMTSVPATVMKGIMYQKAQERITVNENEDELRSELAQLGFDAFEQYYLPRELGGGSGSFQHIPSESGDIRAIKLTDLDSFNGGDSQNSYVLAPVKSDSVIKIYGVGHKKGWDSNFENVDGRQGKIQIAIKVSPPADFEFITSNTD